MKRISDFLVARMMKMKVIIKGEVHGITMKRAQNMMILITTKMTMIIIIMIIRTISKIKMITMKVIMVNNENKK